MAKLICVASQKGGAGKSTLTILLASYLHHAGFPVGVVDADFPQHSIVSERQGDLEEASSDAKVGARLDGLGVASFPIVPSLVERLRDGLPAIKARTQEAFWFVDLPGSLNVKGLEQILPFFDLVIFPTRDDELSFTATMKTIDLYERSCPDAKFFLLWSRIARSESASFRIATKEFFELNRPHIQILEKVFYELVSIRRSVSTLLPSDSEYVRDLLSELIAKQPQLFAQREEE